MPSALEAPAAVAVTVLLLYAIWIGYLLPRSHSGVDFAFLGRHSLQQSAASTIISAPSAVWESHAYLNSMDSTGYDGQFYLFVALDPARAYHHLDMPSYRYTRIGYPLLAREVVANQIALVPYGLIIVNWLAVAGGTLALAAWLARKGVSPWLALLYGLYPGLFTATSLDTAEPLAYGLIALAVYLLEFRGKLRIIIAGMAFALAGLTRETTLIFPAVYAASMLPRYTEGVERVADLRHRCRDAAILFGLAALPFAGYKVFLTDWLGATGMTDYSVLRLPLSGLFGKGAWDDWDTQVLRNIVVPAALCSGVALWSIWCRLRPPQVLLLLVNAWLFVLSLQASSFDPFCAPARIGSGVAVAALLCVPIFDTLFRSTWREVGRLWLFICGFLWLWLDLDCLGELQQIYVGCGQAVAGLWPSSIIVPRYSTTRSFSGWPHAHGASR